MSMCSSVQKPAHKIWFIDEIIRNILAHLPSTGCGNTLASCARVSYALSEPALDMLWYKMSGLVPLLRLLPRSFTEVRKETGEGSTFIPQERVDETEWLRFAQYAQRVRKLHYHYAGGPGERLGQDAFSMLVHHASLTGSSLLPNLQELSWLQFTHVAQCLPFFSPSLRRVTVYVQAAPSTTRSDARTHAIRNAADGYAGLLQLLDACSPCVEELSLEGIEFPAFLALPTVFSHLRILRLGSVSTPTSVLLSHCSKMPRLADLSLVLRRSSDGVRPRSYSGHQSQNARPSLSALEVLRVAGIPSEIEDVLHAIDSPLLHTAALSVSVPGLDTDGWTRCATLLSLRFSPSLRTVRAECTRSSLLVPSQPRDFAQYVQPLLSLRNLHECAITIEDPAGVAMTDGDVENMATSWPDLLSLEISLRGGKAGAPLPSITSLSVFAQRCADLVRLKLPLSQDVSALTSQDSPTLHPSSLRNLWITGVSFSRAESDLIVRFLRSFYGDLDLRPMLNAGILRVP